jgi:type III pantothenate kinase
MDRFFSCFGAAVQVKGGVVVIDAGSACTVDYITADHTYMGGVIMPGHQMLIRSIGKSLPALPGPDTKLPADWPGSTSMDCVRWGTTGVFIEAIRGFLNRYKKSYGEFTLFVTGGDATVLEKNLGDDIKILKRPFLVFEGMEAFVDKYGTG